MLVRSSLVFVATIVAGTALLAQEPGDLPWDHPDGTLHWYRAVAAPPGGIDWFTAHLEAARLGGRLATIESAGESLAVFSLVDAPALWDADPVTGEARGPWLSAAQITRMAEPAGGWVWPGEVPLGYTSWTAGQPDDRGGVEHRLRFGASAGQRAPTWADADARSRAPSFVVEWSGPNVFQTHGLLLDRPGSELDGYFLIRPLGNQVTYLIDDRGRVVHSWTGSFAPGAATYLLPNGNLLRAENDRAGQFPRGGVGGLVEEVDWSGNVVWSYGLSTPNKVLHHDVERLPNGNTLMIAWERKTAAEAIAAGRDPNTLRDGDLWPDFLLEVNTVGQFVWEWHAWDHLVQDFDPTKANYGDVANSPGRLDINYQTNDGDADWMHSNAIDYHPGRDQIILSIRDIDEVWILDHSTTTAEAATSSGGRSGRGGDALFRWGNPEAYRAGTTADRKLFRQHDAQWIEPGLAGAGNILVFSNGTGRPGPIPYSSVEEITPPEPDPVTGTYPRTGAAWGPATATRTITDVPAESFVSPVTSGAQRLPNGATLVTGGIIGTVFEIDAADNVQWRYRAPFDNGAPIQQGGLTSSNGLFRAPYYPASYPGLAGRDLTPGEPLQLQDTALLVDGSRMPAHVRLGDPARFSLRASPANAGDIYLMLTSVTPGLIPFDMQRFVPLGSDPILEYVIGGNLEPAWFIGFIGHLDAQGHAEAELVVPRQIPGLENVTFYNSFLTLDPTRRSGFGFVSNRVEVRPYR